MKGKVHGEICLWKPHPKSSRCQPGGGGDIDLPDAGKSRGRHCELKVVDAKLTVNGQPAKFDVQKTRLPRARTASNSMATAPPAGNSATRSAPEGDYYLGQLILCDQFFDMGEGRYNPLHIYLNDTRLVWATHTMPCRPENAADQTHYQTELRLDKPVRLKPGDTCGWCKPTPVRCWARCGCTRRRRRRANSVCECRMTGGC